MPNGTVFQNYETEQSEDKIKFTQWGLSSNNRESVSNGDSAFLTFIHMNLFPHYV